MTTLETRIAELEAYRAELVQKQVHAWEFERPEQDAQAAEYRRGWQQAFDGIDQQLATLRGMQTR